MTPRTTTPPRWLKPLNKVLITLQRLGIGMKELEVLTVPGRRSGQPRSTPLSVLRREGARYVLEGFPGADWAHNVRANGNRASLRVGKRVEEIRLVELSPSDAEPILREWPAAFADGAKMMVDAGVVDDVAPDAFATLAGRCAVFRLEGA